MIVHLAFSSQSSILSNKNRNLLSYKSNSANFCIFYSILDYPPSSFNPELYFNSKQVIIVTPSENTSDLNTLSFGRSSFLDAHIINGDIYAYVPTIVVPYVLILMTAVPKSHNLYLPLILSIFYGLISLCATLSILITYNVLIKPKNIW